MDSLCFNWKVGSVNMRQRLWILPSLVVCLLWGADLLAEHVERLPPIETTTTMLPPPMLDAVDLGVQPSVSSFPLPNPSDMYLDGYNVSREPLPSIKAGSFFQKLSFTTTHIVAANVPNDMEITELELFSSFAVPFPTTDHPLLINPSFETRFLEGPAMPDAPGTLYSAFVQFLWIPKLSNRWSAILGVEPGLYSDFETDGDEFRLLGRGLLRYQHTPDRLEFVAGLLYLDRDDVPILPAGGVIWVPTVDWRLELLFPIPKIGYRYFTDGRRESWVYAAGEFGGDTWAVQRLSGADDRITLRDLRFSVGWERKLTGGAGAKLEIGYVFGRSFEYTSDDITIDLDDSVLLRASVSY